MEYENIVTFDIHDYLKGQYIDNIVVSVQLDNGGFIKIAEINIDDISSSSVGYFHVFKVGINGHRSHENVIPEPRIFFTPQLSIPEHSFNVFIVALMEFWFDDLLGFGDFIVFSIITVSVFCVTGHKYVFWWICLFVGMFFPLICITYIL